jgi:predicted nucleic-acid-binding protein
LRTVDTNLLVRYLLRDDMEQAASAQEVLSGLCFVPLTVLLEVAWVLTSLAGRSRADTARVLMELMDIPTMTVDQPDLVRWAVGRYAAGGDFADMLHLVGSLQTEAFVTFDRRLAKAAGGSPPVPIETLR